MRVLSSGLWDSPCAPPTMRLGKARSIVPAFGFSHTIGYPPGVGSFLAAGWLD